MKYFDSLFSVILSRNAVSSLTRHSAEFARFLSDQNGGEGPVFRYPDGSIRIEEGTALDRFDEILIGTGLQGTEITGRGAYRSLAAFPKRQYRLYYTGDYQDKLGEDSFLSGPNLYAEESPGELHPEDIQVTVGFRKRINQEIRSQLVATLAGWADGVRGRGLFGEGPVRPLSTAIEFSGNRAWFRIDASRSGQDTLNWLTLVVLNFGYEVATVIGVKYDEEDGLDDWFGPVRGETLFIGLPTETPAVVTPPDGPTVGAAKEDHVPPDAGGTG